MADHIARMRRNDDLLRAAVPLDESVPQDLLDRLGLGAAESNVVSLADARARQDAKRRESRSAQVGGWRMLAPLAAAICIALVGANWISSPVATQPDAAYRTLSSSARPGEARPNALVVFSGTISRAQASAIVARAGGQLIGDATSAGAWKVAATPQQRDAMLARLRAAPGVDMAEPLDGGAP